MNKKLLLFDLGGVLIELSGMQSMRMWTDFKFSEEEIWKIWLSLDCVKLFESGKLDKNSFAKGVIQYFNLPIDEKKFLNDFPNWIKGFYEGVTEFLTNFRNQFFIGCLSNTNHIHWEKAQREWNIKKYFDYCFLSHELNCVKPDEEIFRKAQILSRFPKQEIIFFDDNKINIEAAEKAGIKSFCVKGFENLKREVENNLI